MHFCVWDLDGDHLKGPVINGAVLYNLFRYRQSVLYTATWQKESVAGSLFFHKVTAKIGGTVRFIAIAIILM